MRNLKLRYALTYSTETINPKFLVLDSSGSTKDTIFICTDSELLSYDLNTKTKNVLTEVFGVVSCEYLSLENQICIATEAGEVLLVNPESKNTNDVTFCDGGIEKMAWSPDQEVVAFVTKAEHNVVVMTCNFEPISEVHLDENLFGENDFITVGWGKKETQFHGSEGKTAAKQKTNFVVPDNIKELPQEVDITWREDGAFFAVTFVGPNGRMFKVFDKEGKLKYTSEKVNDLWPPIAWRPSGTWIAVPQKFPNKSTIALFEKNGLRHREIILPFELDSEPVVSIKWSTDSDILAVETILEEKTNLYLYTIGNYHWYLKQTLCFDGILSSFVWDNRIGQEKAMYVILPDGTLVNYRWSFNIDRFQARPNAPKTCAEEAVLVAVIDGKRLLLTDFRQSIIPPPMCTFEIKCETFINSCTFLANKNVGEPIKLILYVANNELHEYVIPEKNEPNKCYKTITIKQSPIPLSCHNFLYPYENKIYWIQSFGTNSKLFNYKSQSIDIDKRICSLESYGKTEILAHSIDGKISLIKLSKEDTVVDINENSYHPGQMCEKIEYFVRLTQSGLISLDIHQHLRTNSETMSTDVTSFHITDKHLVFTQLTVMKFMRLSDWKIVNERKIERGAKIVTIIPHGSLTILQLPRGNLEAIHPRVLCLEMVKYLLDNKRYFDAMDLVRKQRINLNIICDHNLKKFSKNIEHFLKAANPQWLNLFITSLQNEDCTITMYSSNYPETKRDYPEGIPIENKVAKICEKICLEMEKINFHHFLLPIITACVKIGNVEKALEIIWQEKKKEGPNFDGKSIADDAIKYLLYLVDVNQLYDVALGTYDFGLVLMVAKNSQKDPREFLPFFNELKVLEENYRKYKIDVHLKRFIKALVNISRCGENRLEESLSLIKSHNLYKDALEAYKDDIKCYKKIAQAFGDYLRENGKFENASIMYERGDDLTQAIACARNALDWQRCLTLSNKNGTYPREIAISLVPLLIERGRHEDAFELLKKYSSGLSSLIMCLLKGNLFLKAIFEAKLENSPLLESVIAPKLIEYKNELVKKLTEDCELFIKQKTRLATVREYKIKDALAQELDESTEIDEIDLLSDTTSMNSSRYTASSRGTGKTFRSSKNRRKHERKILSLKEGNPFEDIALIDALHNFVFQFYEHQSNIRDTCKALLETSEDGHAREVQELYKNNLKLIRESLDEIWIPEVMTTAQYVTGPNVDYVAMQNEQRYAMLSPLKRFKPQPPLLDWEHEILR